METGTDEPKEPKHRKLTRLGGKVTYFQGSKMTQGQMVKGEYLDTQIDEKYGIPKYRLAQEDGSIHIVNSTARLVGKMQNVKSGMYLEITYLGMSMGKNGKLGHDWDVLADLENPLPGGPVGQDEVPF